MRDIAEATGIKPASLYNHFTNKETFWQEVLEYARDLYLLYFKELERQVERADSFAGVLEAVFHEPKRLANIFTCYAFSLIQAVGVDAGIEEEKNKGPDDQV